MHIVYVSREYLPTLRGGGIASYVYNMSRFLADQGHRVTVICASDDTRNESDEAIGNLRIIRLPKGDFCIPSIEGIGIFKKLRCLTRFYAYRKRIQKEIERLEAADIVEVPEYGAEALYLLTKLSVPVVLRLHTPSILDRYNCQPKCYPLTRMHEWFCSFKENEILKKARYISSCSESLKQWVMKYLNINGELVSVIYNPVDVDEWSMQAKKRASKKEILYIGTIAEEKGISELLNAVQLARETEPDISLVLAGKMGKFGETKKKEFVMERWCRFLGGVGREGVKKLLSEHCIVCVPSWWENMPMVCIEAMMCGCVVIGSSCGGMSEIIEDGISGFLSPPKDAGSLAKSILKVLDLSDEQISSIGSKAQERIRSAFSMQEISTELLTYYKKVICDYHEKRKNTLG